MNEPTIDSIGKRISAIRGKISRDVFAPTMGISKSTLQRYETDEREPDASFLLAVRKCGINPLWILTGEGEMKMSGAAASEISTMQENNSHKPPNSSEPFGPDFLNSETLKQRILIALTALEKQKNAAKAGISTDQLLRYKNCETLPPLDVIARIAKVVGMSLDWIATGKGPFLLGDSKELEPINLGRLVLALEVVEEGLKITRREMPPHKKAMLVATAYDLFSEDVSQTVQDDILSIVKTAA